jgi:hypothetical protein
MKYGTDIGIDKMNRALVIIGKLLIENSVELSSLMRISQIDTGQSSTTNLLNNFFIMIPHMAKV